MEISNEYLLYHLRIVLTEAPIMSLARQENETHSLMLVCIADKVLSF